jgi:hypothetical protein
LEELVQRGWQHVKPASGYSWRHPRSGAERQIDHVFLSASLVPRRAEYSWGFERLAPEGASRKVGYPDHALLICEFNLASESVADSQGRKTSELAAQPGDQV